METKLFVDRSSNGRPKEKPIPQASSSVESSTMSSMRQRYHGTNNSSVPNMKQSSQPQHYGTSYDDAAAAAASQQADIAAGGGDRSSIASGDAGSDVQTPMYSSASFRPGILKRPGYSNSEQNGTPSKPNSPHMEDFAESFGMEMERQSQSESHAVGSSKLTVLGIDVSHLSRKTQFCLCAGGVFGFSLIYGFLQELLSTQILNRQLGLFLALSQFVGYTFWSFLFRTYVENKHGLSRVGQSPAVVEGYYNKRGVVTSALTPSSSSQSLTDMASEAGSVSGTDDYGAMGRGSSRKKLGLGIPTRMYVGLSILRAIDLGMTNMAMQYVNYPAKTLMKSSRVVFTMLFGIVVLRRAYKTTDYVVVGLMVAGLGTFLHADFHTSAVFQPIGIVMLATALMCDGAITNMSESLMKEYNVGQDEYIFRLYSIATVAIALGAAFKGDLVAGHEFMMVPGTYDEIAAGTGADSQWTVMKKFFTIVLFSTTGFLGSSCAAAITKEFSALTMSITSTARKATTLFISFMIFPNECTWEHVVGIFIFLSSLVVKAAGKGCGNGSGSRKMKRSKSMIKSSAPNSLNMEGLGHMVV